MSNVERTEEIIKLGIESNNKTLHTSMPGKIVIFDPVTQLATIQPAIDALLNNDDQIKLPELIKVPVMFFRGGGFSITMPVNPGDECLIIFCEKSIDRWKKDGAGFVPSHSRTHDLSDGVAILGLYSQGNVIDDFDNDNLSIKNDNAEIKIDSAGNITIENNSASIVCNSSGDITIANDIASIVCSASGNIVIENAGAKFTLFNNGKIGIESKTTGENLINVLKDLAQTLAITTVTVDAVPYPLDQQSTFSTLASKLQGFI